MSPARVRTIVNFRGKVDALTKGVGLVLTQPKTFVETAFEHPYHMAVKVGERVAVREELFLAMGGFFFVTSGFGCHGRDHERVVEEGWDVPAILLELRNAVAKAYGIDLDKVS